MSEQGTSAGNLKLVGGQLCLDFANTVDWHSSDHPHEWLRSYSDLVAWSQHVGISTDKQARHLLEAAAQAPERAAAVLEHALAVREAIYHIFSAMAAGHVPDTADVATLNEVLPATLSRLQLAVAAEGATWVWAPGEDDLEQILWPVIRSAADLLTSEEVHRVRECSNEECGWLFVDTSKNHSRRWCTMESCGNRAKARRHYRRSRAST
jgi:predicted RNA-binding Zn ribbon-like protein